MKSDSLRLNFEITLKTRFMQARDFKTEVLPISNKLLRFARQILQDEEEAKDVLQDIFLKLWQKREELVKVDNLEAFTFRMMRNRCLDVIRLRRTVSLEVVKKNNRLEEESSDTDYLENEEMAGLVRRIITELPDLQRTIIHLRDIEQLEYEEIAEATNLNVNAIRVNLSRARKRVRDEILKIQNYGITENTHTTAKIL
jgi:RNA polymerase sigma-70 factor (ECF subfamily)